MFNCNCPNLPAGMLGVDVTRNTLTTMSIQLQPKSALQLVEDGLKGMPPSSFTQSSQPQPQHTQKPRIPTLNVTQNNIERHAKTPPNSATTTNQNQQQSPKRNQKSLTSTTKNFPAPNVLAPNPEKP